VTVVLPQYDDIAPDVFTPIVTVETLRFVYITVRIGKSIRAKHVYWHLVEPSFSLLELGFEVSSRRLTAISVPVFKGRIGTTHHVLPTYTGGDPLFDMKEMVLNLERNDVVPDVLKSPGRISLTQSGEDIDILLADTQIARAICCNHKITYGFNGDKRLCLIRLHGQ